MVREVTLVLRKPVFTIGEPPLERGGQAAEHVGIDAIANVSAHAR